jgi:hypothetical protein
MIGGLLWIYLPRICFISSIGVVGSSSGSEPYLCNNLSNMPAMNTSSEYAIHGNNISNKSIGTNMYPTHATATILTHIGDLLN